MTQTEVYAPKSVQLWKTVMNWLSFMVQILVQIVKTTSSVAQVFSYIGVSQGRLLSPSPPAFKLLPVVEIPLESAAVNIAGSDGGDADADGSAGSRLAKLTVC